MPLHRLIPAALLCLFALAAMAEEPSAPETTTLEATTPATSDEATAAEPAKEPEQAPAITEPAQPTEAMPEQPAAEGSTPSADTAAPTQAPEAPQTPLESAPAETPAEAPSADILMPERGMTMDEVEAAFGPPPTKLPAVGKPPITRWVYADYTVYFEYSEVVHAVRNDPRSDQP